MDCAGVVTSASMIYDPGSPGACQMALLSCRSMILPPPLYVVNWNLTAFSAVMAMSATGKLMLDKAKIRTEAQFDGKFLVSTSCFGLSAEDVVFGYKQLSETERVFRDMKHLIDIRPVRHRLPDRIKAHVLLCWLGILLILVAEQETDHRCTMAI